MVATEATKLSSKSITSISGCKLYKLDELADEYVLHTGFGKVWAVFIQTIEATTPQYCSYTLSSDAGVIIFETSGTTDADVMVFGE